MPTILFLTTSHLILWDVKGIRIVCANPRAFESLFAPVMSEIASRYWVIDSQSGRFRITEKPNFRQLEDTLDTYFVNVHDFEDFSETLWRPGVFPKFANLLVVDEWTYLLGIDGPEQDAVRKAIHISRFPRFSDAFFTAVSSACALLLIFADGWWHVYSDATDIFQRFAELPNASGVDSSVLVTFSQGKHK